MRFSVVGADKDTGDDVDVVLVAGSREVAEAEAGKKGILVSAITQLPEKVDKDAIELVADEEGADEVWAVGGASAAAGAGGGVGVAKGKGGHGVITLSANSPSETGFSGEAGARNAGAGAAAGAVGLEYHVIMNQALYLLETAVNKHLRDGWEPAGGLAVGVSNNALQYFQAVVRKREAKG